MNIKSLILAVILCLSAMNICAFAQPQQPPHPSERKEMTPEAVAKRKTEKMNRDLQLSEKQYKKVYKLFLQEEKSLSQNAPSMFPPMGEGGMPPMGGGTPPQRPDMVGGRPPQMGQGQHPDMPPMEMRDNHESKERIAKKLKKILTEQQYDRWESLQTQELMNEMDFPIGYME